MTAETHDSISLRGAGIVTVLQSKNGFRFNQDSILLADFCRIKPGDRVLEPGAGTGVVSMLLARKFPRARFVADEIEPHAYELLCRNIEKNGLSAAVVPVDRDLQHLHQSYAQDFFDVIVANPPYTKYGTGKKSPSTERQLARQDRIVSLPLWLNLEKILKTKGRYCLVFPANRAAELMSLLRERKLEPKRVRFVHPSSRKPASLVLIEAVKSAGIGLEVLGPMIVHGPDGKFSKELTDIYGCSP